MEFGWELYGLAAYRDKKVVGVFVRFRAPFHLIQSEHRFRHQEKSEFQQFLFSLLFSIRIRQVLISG
jgi:hypothetical protein